MFGFLFSKYHKQEDKFMNQNHKEKLKRLISVSLREKQDSYVIQSIPLNN